MATVTAVQAKSRFGELLDRVAGGEEIVITRHDKPVAKMTPVRERNLEKVREAVSQLRALREEIALRPGFKPLTVKEIRDAINYGRR
jgi:prevent-host-death family protein